MKFNKDKKSKNKFHDDFDEYTFEKSEKMNRRKKFSSRKKYDNPEAHHFLKKRGYNNPKKKFQTSLFEDELNYWFQNDDE